MRTSLQKGDKPAGVTEFTTVEFRGPSHTEISAPLAWQPLASQLHLRELETAGVQFVMNDAVAFAQPGFPFLGQAVILARVNFNEALPSIAHAGRGDVRVAVVGAHGTAIVHSAGAPGEYGQSEVFNRAISPTLTGARVEGTGTYVSADRQVALAHYERVDNLPVALLIEQVAPMPGAVRPTEGVTFGEAASAALILLTVLGSSAWFAGRRRKEPELDAANELAWELGESPILPGQNNIEMDIEIVPASPVVSDDSAPIRVTHSSLTGQLEGEKSLEKVFFDEFEKDDRAFRSELDANVMLSKFEMEAIHVKDPQAFARKLTAFASKFAGAPTMYFAYHDRLRAAILVGTVGAKTGAMHFGLDDPTLAKILQSPPLQPYSLKDHAPLKRVILGHGLGAFEAWAVSGFLEKRLAGVLVVLRDQNTVEKGFDPFGKNLPRVLRATGLMYENASL